MATTYRNVGNEYYTDHYETEDAAAAEFYTKAIYSSPKDSVEIALAHANRAAAFMRTDFLEEGYHDCQMAIKFNYPNDKLLKLLHRKVFFAIVNRNRDHVIESIRELEELLQAGDYGAGEQTKCKSSTIPTRHTNNTCSYHFHSGQIQERSGKITGKRTRRFR